MCSEEYVLKYAKMSPNIYTDPKIDKYKYHPSTTYINKRMTNSELTFTFQPVTKNQISNLIKLLYDKKAVQSTSISN